MFWLSPSEPRVDRGYKLLCKTSAPLGAAPPSLTAPAHCILGTSPSLYPFGPGDGNWLLPLRTFSKYKRKFDAETSRALSVIPTTTKDTCLAHFAFNMGAYLPPSPTKSQLGRSLPLGSVVRSIAPEAGRY